MKTAGRIFKVSHWVLDFCFPPKCIICQKRLEEEESGPLCGSCQECLPRTAYDTRQIGLNFDRCVSPLYYTEAWKQSFHRYKFQGHWHYSAVYGSWMWECLKEREPDFLRFDCITWTPLSARRWLKRGYDQAGRLAQAVSRYSGIPLERTLVKRKNIAPQSGTEQAADRWKNVKGAYALKRGMEIRGKRILLVDDIITTGATLEEASSVLRSAGAKEICCLTLARSVVRIGKEAAT